MSPAVKTRLATVHDIPGCKRIADQNRDALGFLTRGVFADAVANHQLLVAQDMAGNVVGFVRFNHRRKGTETALYDIGVDLNQRRSGVGRSLVVGLVEQARDVHRHVIVLRCPADLAANGFYERLGFQHGGREPGRRRDLNVWRLDLRGALWNL